VPRVVPYTGAAVYAYPDQFTDVLLNGASVKDLQIVEVSVDALGQGYVMCLRTLDKPDVAPHKMIDGQYLTHTYYGEITIVP
jgi:hypothetical protein